MSNRPAAPTARRRKVDGITSNTKTHAGRPLLDGNIPGGGNGGITTGLSISQINGFSHIVGSANNHNHNHNPSIGAGGGGGHGHYPPSNAAADDDDPNITRHPSLLRSLLQPRLAVFLGVPRRWHPFLFICRLWSIGPAIYWGFPSIVRLLALIYLKYIAVWFGTGTVAGGGIGAGSKDNRQFASSMATAASSALHGAPTTAATYDWSSLDVKLRFTEAWITVLWCCASGWVSFFLTDSLMSRALLHYTPLATIFRLSVINLLNVLFTSFVLGQFAAPANPQYAFAPWIIIASVLTFIYYIAQRGIRIHKEYAMSMSIFSIASYLSMVALLWHMHIDRAIEYPEIPLVHNIRLAYQNTEKLAVKIMEYGNAAGGL
ncbi:N-glycosylation domain containing protein [Naviculisporaceae sp. PSN 640]